LEADSVRVRGHLHPEAEVIEGYTGGCRVLLVRCLNYSY
jgi:hypothetical protein